LDQLIAVQLIGVQLIAVLMSEVSQRKILRATSHFANHDLQGSEILSEWMPAQLMMTRLQKPQLL
jgi:hypothetical protein